MKTRIGVVLIVAIAMLVGATAVFGDDGNYTMGTAKDVITSASATQAPFIPSGAVSVASLRDHDASFFAPYEATGVSGPSEAMVATPYFPRLNEKR